ncbi:MULTISPECIES: hypothetical protein [unclassified Bradyrhizobium]|uniref:hypothetical protein n=1 Tax=Bradyrhizobium sp. NBAIM08 TaxID=2793815 RepID=UPI001FCBD898|nr:MULTISPECIES: hypothetical protein [Bradyrhizobium]
MPVGSRTDAIEKLEWYGLRWKIEVFHKILKSGCKAEESKLRTAQRLTNLISLFCILSWPAFWMTMLNRSAPDAPPTLALTVICGWQTGPFWLEFSLRKSPRLGGATDHEGLKRFGRPEGVHPETGQRRGCGGEDLPQGRDQPGDLLQLEDEV